MSAGRIGIVIAAGIVALASVAQAQARGGGGGGGGGVGGGGGHGSAGFMGGGHAGGGGRAGAGLAGPGARGEIARNGLQFRVGAGQLARGQGFGREGFGRGRNFGRGFGRFDAFGGYGGFGYGGYGYGGDGGYATPAEPQANLGWGAPPAFGPPLAGEPGYSAHPVVIHIEPAPPRTGRSVRTRTTRATPWPRVVTDHY